MFTSFIENSQNTIEDDINARIKRLTVFVNAPGESSEYLDFIPDIGGRDDDITNIALPYVNVHEEFQALAVSEKKSDYKNFIIAGFIMLIVQIIYAFFPIVLKLFAKDTAIDISFLVFFRVVPPIFIMCLVAYFIEGKYSLNYSLKEYAMLGFMGLIGTFYFPFAGIYIGIYTNVSFLLVTIQLVPIFNSIASYIFRLEIKPSYKKPFTLLILFGILLSIGCSLVIVYYNFINSENNIPTSNWISCGIISLTALATYAFYLSYQIVFYITPIGSKFHRKPLSFMAVSSIVCFCIIIPPFLITLGIRWKEVRNTAMNPQSWIALLYSSILNGAVGGLLIAYCNTKTSPLFVGTTFTIQILIGLIAASIIIKEVLNTVQYVMCAGLAVGVILVMVGKYFLRTTKKKSRV